MRYKNRFIAFVAVFMIVFSGNALSQVFAGKIVSRELKSENDILITYNLTGLKGVEYEVDLFLVWGTNNRLKLEKTTGDIGSGILPGMGRTVHWDMKAELPNVIEGMPYSFELDVKPRTGGGLAWYWYAGGAAAAGGIAYLIFRPGTQGSSQQLSPGSSIPLPPGLTR
jgi:hypothetical protein